MSKEIDQRVVEMKFNNKEFEKNAQESLSTIDKLKEKLKFKGASKGLEEVSQSVKKVDFNPLSNGIESAKLSFSAFEVIAITTLQNITNKVINTGEQLVKSLSIDQITSGWDKYAQKTSSVQTIMNATGKSIDEVNEYLAKLMWFSDETSYGFTDMTQSLGQLTSSGADIEKIIPMITGVANATAYAGKGAAEFSRVIYNLNQSYGAGYLQLTDWKSIELAGVASAQLKQELIDTGVALGKINEGEVTLANFTTTLADKWADTEVMEAAFGKFSEFSDAAYDLVQSGAVDTASEAIAQLSGKYGELGEKAFKSAQEAKTFTEAIDATKDAVSSGWMETFEIIFGNYEEAKVLWTDLANVLWDVFASGGEARNDLLREALGGDKTDWSAMSEQIDKTGISLENFQNGLMETAKAHGIAIDDMIAESGSFEESLKNGWLSTDIFTETLDKYADGAEGFEASTESMAGSLEDFQKVFNDVWSGKYGNGQKRIEALTNAGYDYDKIQQLVNRHSAGYKLTLEDLNDLGVKNVSYTEEQVKAMRELASEAGIAGSSVDELIEGLSKPTGRELLIDSARNAISGLIKVMDIVKSSWNSVFPSVTASGLYNFLEKLHDMSNGLILNDRNTAKLSITLKGLFSVVELVADILSGGFKAALKVASAFINELNFGVLDLTRGLGDSLKSFTEWIRNNETIKRAVNSVVSAFTRLASSIGKVVNSVYTFITTNSTISVSFSRLFTAIGRVINQIFKFIDALFGTELAQDMFSGFFTTVRKGFELFVELLANGAEKLAEFIEGFGEFDSVGSVLEYVSGKIKDVVTSFGGIQNISLENITTLFTGFKNNVEDAFYGSDLRIVGFSETLTNLKTTANLNIKNIGDRFSWLKDRVLDFIDLASDKVPSVMALGGAAIFIKSLNSISDALVLLSQPIKIVKDSFTALTTAFKNIGKAVAFSQQASGILKIAVAIGVLAFALYQLASLDQGNLWSSVGALSAIAVVLGVIAGAMGALTKLGKIGDFSGSAKSLIGMAAALLILSKTLEIMEGIDFESAIRNSALLVGLAIGLGVAVGILSKLSGKNPVSAAGLVAMALSLMILAFTLSALKDYQLGDVIDSLGILAILVGMLGVLSRAAGAIKFTTGVGLFAMVLALRMFLGVLEDILDFPEEKLQNGIGNLIIIVGTLAILFVAMGFAGKSASGAGIGLLAIVIAVKLLIGSVDDLAEIAEGGKLPAAMKAITQILLILAAAVALSHFAGANAMKAGMMLIEMAGALLIIVGVMYLLSAMDASDIDKGLRVIDNIGIMFAALIVVSKFAKDVKGTMISIAIAIAAVAAVVLLLGGMSEENVNRGIKALGAVTVMVGILIVCLKLLGDAKPGKALIALAGLMLIVAGIVLLMTKLVDIGSETGKLIEIAGSISLILIALAASCALLGRMGNISANAFVAMVAMTAVLGLIGIVVKLLMDTGLDVGIELAGSLSILLLSISAACLVASAIGPVAGGALAGIGVMIAAVAALGAFILAIGAVFQDYESYSGYLDSGLEVLKKLGLGLGEAIGNIVGGVLLGATSTLPQVGENLSSFMESMDPFIEGCKELDSDVVMGIGTLADMALKLSAANVIQGFANLLNFGSPGENFGDNLAALADGVKKYSDAVSGESFDKEAIASSVETVGLLVDLNDRIPTTGFLNRIIGEKSLTNFAAQITNLATGIVAYSDIVNSGNIDKEAIDYSIDAIGSIVELNDKIPESGFLPWLKGEKNVGTFGNQCRSLAGGIVEYSNAVSGANIDKTKIDESVAAMGSILGLYDILPEQSVLGKFVDGEVDLGSFGTQIGYLGQGLATYYNSISSIENIDPSLISQTVGNLSELIGIAKILPEDRLFDGKMNLTDFGLQLSDLAGGFGRFIDNVNGADEASISSAVNGIASIGQTLQGINGIDPVSVETFIQALKDLGTVSIEAIVSQFEGSGETIGVAIDSMMLSIVNGISTNTESITIAANSLISSFAIAITTSTVVYVTPAVMQMMASQINTINGYLVIFNSAAMMLIMQYVAGINIMAPSAIASVNNIMANSVNSINSFYQSFYNAAVYLADGLIQGMADKEQDVYNAAFSLGQKAVQGEKDGQRSNSPSKETIKAGKWLGEGLIIGMNKMGKAVYESGKGLGQYSTSAVSDALDSIKTAFDEGIEYNPTIRPVIDFDSIDEGINGINSAFSLKRAINLSGTISKANIISAKNDEIQNGNSEHQNSGDGSVSFYQYNYSPKALSRQEIYRSTNNQLSRAKDAIRRRR